MVCYGTRDIKVSTVPESVAVPVPQHPRRVSNSVGGLTNNALHFVASQSSRRSTLGSVLRLVSRRVCVPGDWEILSATIVPW